MMRVPRPRPSRARGGIAALVMVAGLGWSACAAGPPDTPSAPDASWSDVDWAVFQEKARWALAEGLDTIPLGESMARLGRAFVGTPYVPGSLEVEGPESLVINFRGLDCVTFVENVFALSRFVRSEGAEAVLQERGSAEGRYEALLTEHRYRGGVLAGYPSRLHYFTDWVADAQTRGLVRDVTRELGGSLDSEPVDFMTTHTEAYRQLADPGYVDEVRKVEARLSAAGRWYLPENEVEAAAPSIRNGDIIAATSTVEGLDVAHTGLALWVDGSLHLLHAPLVGEAVQISETPLSERLLRIGSQDGVIIARPVDGG